MKKRPHTCLFCPFLHSCSCVPLSGPWLTSLTSVITSQFPMRSARGGEGEWTKTHDMFTATWISNINNLFIVQDSTLCPTPPASLMAMCGPCTSNTGGWWRTATWESVRWNCSIRLGQCVFEGVIFKRLPPCLCRLPRRFENERGDLQPCVRGHSEQLA